MKSIKEIQALTKKALVKKQQRRKLEEKKEINKIKKERKEAIQSVKDSVNFLHEQIEETASKGKSTYSADIEVDVLDPKIACLKKQTRLEIKYIKKQLGDFDPVFKFISRKTDNATEIMYTDSNLDYKEWYYLAYNVTFTW